MNDIVNQKDIESLVAADDIFNYIHETCGPPPNWNRPQGFVSLSKIILGQQVSLASAQAHFSKLEGYLAEFTPSCILKLTDTEMRYCQISRQKSEYLRALSSAVIQKQLVLEELETLDSRDVRKQLTRIKGIGDWSADIYLMFCLKSKDIFPYGDIAVIHSVRELCHIKTRGEVAPLAERWKPLRSLAAYYLWHYYLKKRNRFL